MSFIQRMVKTAVLSLRTVYFTRLQGNRVIRMSKGFKHGPGRGPVNKYISDTSLRLTPQQKKLIQVTAAQPYSIMLSCADELQLLQNLVRSIRGKKTIDIGVYTGYSALSIALALPEDGTVIAMDVDDRMPNIGRPFWREAGVEKKIDLRIGPALNTLESLLNDGKSIGTFDFAFVDADKENYDNYYEACLKLLRPGGIIAFDNMLGMGGHVLDPNNRSSSIVALRNLAHKLHTDQRVDVSFLNTGDGTYLAFKR